MLSHAFGILQQETTLQMKKLDDSVARKKAGGHSQEASTQENMIMNAAGEEHRPVYTPKFLRTEAFTQTGTFTQRSLYTERLLDTKAFTQRSLYTDWFLHAEVFTQRNRYTEQLLHTEVFTQRSLDTKEMVLSLWLAFWGGFGWCCRCGWCCRSC